MQHEQVGLVVRKIPKQVSGSRESGFRKGGLT